MSRRWFEATSLAALAIAFALALATVGEARILPKGYRIDLSPLLVNATYKGRVRIDFVYKAHQDHNQLLLNVDDSINIQQKDIRVIRLANDDLLSDEESEEDEPISVSGIERNLNTVTVVCSRNLQIDVTYQLDMTFDGQLTTDPSRAFYRDSYSDQTSGETRWFGVLNANRNNMHQVFPCIDDSIYKSWVELVVMHEHGYAPLSNTPIIEEANITKFAPLVRSKFSRTPLMNINSLGLFISDFRMPQVEYLKTDGIKIGVWGRPDFATVLSKAQQVLPSVLVSLELYLSRPYPLQHLNFIALPGYIGDRPKNSWGLQWFKESDLMNSNSYWLTHRIAKASAMQWLGHLATPVNESIVTSGLANYLATIVAKQLEPSVYSWSLSSFHTIVLELGKARNFGIDSDQMAFLLETKVSLLMQMFEEVLGAPTFKQAIQNFLAKKEFKTYKDDDLWQVITEQAWVDKKLAPTLTLGEISKQWLKKRIPLVTVVVDYKKNLTTFTQEEYIDNFENNLSKVVKKGGVDTNPGWWIPLAVKEGGAEAIKTVGWLPPDQHSVTVKNISTSSYILLNPASSGPYLVNYDAEGWKRLTASFESQPADVRAQLLHDSLSLALSGHLPSVTALKVTAALKNEQSPEVWKTFFPLAERLRKRFQGTPAANNLDAYIKALLIPVLNAIGEEDKHAWKNELRLKTRHLLCQAGFSPCVDNARTLFASWVNATHPDEAMPIPSGNLCPVMAWGSLSEWEFALDRLRNFPKNRTRSERTFLMKAVAGCPRDQKKYETLINMTFFDDNYTTTFSDEDRFVILASISGEPIGYKTLFEILKTRWPQLKSRLQLNLWEFFIHTAMGSFRTEEDLNEIKSLIEEKKSELGSASKACDESVARVEARVKWSKENTPAVEVWLNKTMEVSWIQQKFKFNDIVVATATQTNLHNNPK